MNYKTKNRKTTEWLRWCCGLTQQAAKHCTTIRSFPSPSRQVLWFSVADRWALHRHLPSQEDEGENQKKKKKEKANNKVELVDWDRNYLLRERKTVMAVCMYVYIWMCRTSEAQGIAWHFPLPNWTQVVEDSQKNSNPLQNSFHLKFHTISYGMKYPFASVSQLSWFCLSSLDLSLRMALILYNAAY